MATLTEVASFSRKGIKFGVIGLVALLILPGAWTAFQKFLISRNPPPPTPPTLRYGKLPKIVFPAGVDLETPEYMLETIEGTFPKFDLLGKVYIVGINRSRLLTLDRIRDMAYVLGFSRDLVPLDEKRYKFVNQSTGAEIVFNIVTGDVTYHWDWTTDTAVLKPTTLPQAAQAIAEAKEVLNKMNLFTPELAAGQARTMYLKAEGTTIRPASTYFDADFVRVDFFRSNIDKLQVYTSGVDTSPVSLTLSGLAGNKRFTQFSYQFSPTLDKDFATYPLKPIATAWEELQSGKGFVAKKSGKKVVVRNIVLGYYESSEPQDFLQPVYVFNGDGDFRAYVSAISDEYVLPNVIPTALPVNTEPTRQPTSLPTTPTLKSTR